MNDDLPIAWQSSRIAQQTIAQQRQWAERRGLAVGTSGTRFAELTDALFAGQLRTDTFRELEKGRGREIPRLTSFRSSSCLAVNFFEPWRAEPQRVADVFGVIQASTLSFESVQRTAISDPHLDVLIEGTPTLGIECKFLEPYDGVTSGAADSRPTPKTLNPRYVTTPGMWDGIESCGALAERIVDGSEVFRRLDAPQLLKHAAGLRLQHPSGFRLAFVWYRVEGPEATQLEQEIGRFTRATSADLDYVPMTYQELAGRLRGNNDEPTTGYWGYIEDRYGLGPHPMAASRPLIDLVRVRHLNRTTGMAAAAASLDSARLAESYNATVANAPRRRLRGKRYLVTHARDTSTDPRSETVRAKALATWPEALAIAGRQVRIVGYEIPLKAARIDQGVGKIDLLGLEPATGRPWLIELKVASKGATGADTPLKAMLQCLGYSALVDANRQAFTREMQGILDRGQTVTWPAVLAVAADSAYWRYYDTNTKAGRWRQELYRLQHDIEATLGIEIHLLDLGDLTAELTDAELTEHLPKLTAPPAVTLV